MDLLDCGLTPQEFMAAHYLQRVSGRASGKEIAAHLDISERGGRRVLVSLAEKGLIQRVRQGRFVLLWLAESRPRVAESRPRVTESKVLSTTSSKSVLVDMSNDISTRAARPIEGTHIKKRFPMADDLEPGRLKPIAKKPAKRTLFNKPDKYHRLTQPREEWGIPHLVKEFGIRYQHAFPESVYVVEGRKLSSTLAMAQRDYGLSVVQLMTAIEQFFDHRSKGVPDNVSPTRVFLAYLKEYIRQQPGYGNATFDGDGF